jgi:membrane protein
MMASIRSAFRAVWGSDADRPFLRGKLLDVLLVFGAGLLVVFAFLSSIVVQVLTETGAELARKLGREDPALLSPLAQLASSTALSALAFLLLYRVVPPLAVRVRDVAPAAVLAGVAVQVAAAGFSVYLTRFADFDDVYGPLGAVLAFLLLVYVIAIVLLLGACLAAAWPEAASPAPASQPGGAMPFRARIVRVARGLVLRHPR